MPAPITATSSTGPYSGCRRGSSQSFAGGITSSSRSRAKRASSSASECGPGAGILEAASIRSLTTEIGIADARVVQQIARRARQHDAAGLQHIAVVGDLEREMAFCSTMKIVTPCLLIGLDQLQHPVDVERRQAHGRLVHADAARAAHQRARHGDHLLLAARERAGALVEALAQRAGTAPSCARSPQRSPPRSLRVKAPISRFSRTVIAPNRRRASGTEPSPRRMICGVGRPVIGCAVEASRRRSAACSRPRMTFMVVDLPLALPPSRQTIWPRPTVEATGRSGPASGHRRC